MFIQVQAKSLDVKTLARELEFALFCLYKFVHASVIYTL